MTILFESYLFPDSLLDTFRSKSKVALDFAAHNLCKAIITGIKENGVNLRIINAPNIGSFPSYYSSPFVPGTKLNEGISLSFVNITYFKRRIIRNKLFQAINKELRAIPPSEETALLLYNFRCLPIISKIKKRWPSIKVIMIVTDLPWNTSMAPSRLTDIGKRIVGTSINLNHEDLQLVDGYVLLAPKMLEALHVENKPWCHMEGIYESETMIGSVEKEQEKVILYTGNLGKKYGITRLLDAFNAIEGDDYRLWFRGGGDCKDEIERRMLTDKRISILPQLSRKDLLALQKRATILINPVEPTQSFTNYFFPSKTLEYLASGTPVVMYHLSCMPEEYNKYIYYIEDETVESMRDKIVEVCSMSQNDMDIRAKQASSFILNNKTPKPQVKRMIEFINSITI